VDESHILMVNGDTFTDLDFVALVQDHIRTGADATIAVHGREDTIDFGVISHLDDGALDTYIEKPTTKYLVSMGVNVVHTKHLPSFHPPSYIDLPDFLRATKQRGGRVHCHETDCFWLDLGRLEDVKQAQIEYEIQHERFTTARKLLSVAN
jgi:NDP-sugar pyrophosphorylase family protein